MATYLEGIGLGASQEVIVAQPSAVTAIARLVGAAPLGVLKDQLMVRSLNNYAAYLPAAFDQEQFAFYGTTLSGTPEQELRWKRAVSFTTGRARRRRQQDLRRAPLPARDQGRGRYAGQERRRGDGAADRRAGVDGARDQGPRARQARRLRHQDRLSRPLAGLCDARDPRRRCARQCDARRRMGACRRGVEARRRRSAAGNGA